MLPKSTYCGYGHKPDRHGIYFSNDEFWRTNMLLRQIEIGETFAVGNNLRGRHGEDYWIYRIDSVRRL